ncbi:hypothetical protein OG225_40540 (plasmid) [Nocardia sp. NBC_01377]|uniref:hypothetical protein n=1 Tax=Nocardia sp. NBC_01377 TaxID=2903595 RepID=UPI002F912DFC
MTRSRRRKAAIRSRQADTRSPYMVARRQLHTSDPSEVEVPDSVRILPPLKTWTRSRYCRYWAETRAEHGPLVAVTVSYGAKWFELDDIVRVIVKALPILPADERGLWIPLEDSGYALTRPTYLGEIATTMQELGALPRLTIRALPDPARCDHASCGRRREHSRPQPARAPARRTVAHEPLRTLAEVMAEHPRLGLHGIGIGLGYQPDQTPEQHALSLTAARASLTEREPAVREIAHWLRDHLPPVSTCYVDSYYLRRVAESATGVFYYDGQFIAAALAAGYPHRYGEERYLDIGVSGRDLKQITADPPSF